MPELWRPTDNPEHIHLHMTVLHHLPKYQSLDINSHIVGFYSRISLYIELYAIVAIKKATSTTPSGKNAQPNLFLTLKEKGES